MHGEIMKKKGEVSISLLFMAGLWGGFYEFAAAVYVLLFLGLIRSVYREKKRIEIPKNKTTYCMIIISVCYVCSVFTAIDKGMAVLGLIKIFAAVLFYLLWCNLSSSKKVEWIDKVPEVGAVLTGIALIGYYLPGVRERLYQANRLGGTFQYSNTYALFLLVGIIILMYQKTWNRKYVTETIILVIGILYTGSRTVLVLTVCVIVFCMIQGKMNRQAGFAMLIGVGIAVIAVLFVYQLNIGRLWKITLDSSTLNGRLLYYKDAVSVIMKHPLGLGYMGYYYLQPQFQTGRYVTRFVHNEILQYGLDAGWLAMAALLIIFLTNLFSKENTQRNKLILCVLLLHCLFDFDLQYPIMVCVFIMSLSGRTQMVRKDNQCSRDSLWVWNGTTCRVGGVLLLCVSIYVFGVSLCHYVGLDNVSMKLYPWHTEARVSSIQKDARMEEIETVIRQNGMIASVYETEAKLSIETGDYERTKNAVQEMLKCAGYDMYYYNQAVYLDSHALDQALRSGNKDVSQEILTDILNIPNQLETLKKNTSSLAYRTVDAPDFELEESVQRYLNSVAEACLKK